MLEAKFGFGFSKIAYYADQILIADTPGATRCNIQKVEYKNVDIPLYPFSNI